MKKIITILFLLLYSTFASADYYANDTLNLHTITVDQAFEIFTFQSKFIGSDRIVIVLPPYGTRSFKMLSYDLGKTSASYYDIVQSKTHAGTANPIWVEAEASVLRKVASTPHSIGFYHDKIAINTGAGVRIINVR